MDNLWKKEANPNSTGARYVDLFGADQTNRLAATIKLLNITQTCKDNKTSTEFRNIGNEYFREKEWKKAMLFYNKSLRYAEINTENVALAYSNRSACFFQMKKYAQVLADIDLAKNENLPVRLVPKLEQRKKISMEFIESDPFKYIPKLSYKANKNVPCLADVVEIKYNNKFGRHLVATRPIPVGKTILVDEFYIKTIEPDEVSACDTCFLENSNLIACVQCTRAMFCSIDCQNRNQLHKWVCGTIVERHDNGFRSKIHSILLAIETFKDADALMTYVENILLETSKKMPTSITDPKLKYQFFFKLHSTNSLSQHDLMYSIFLIFSILMKIPKIETLFDSDEKRRFLMHLILHHTLVVNTNAIGCSETYSLSNIQSLFNHSCAPNICHYYIGNQRVCYTIRPVKAGEQLFISYIDEDWPTAKRLEILKSTWGFVCKCDKCESTNQEIHSRRMKEDPRYKFIKENHDLDEIFWTAEMFLAVMENCVEFLNMYGHLPWSKEIEFVASTYDKIFFDFIQQFG